MTNEVIASKPCRQCGRPAEDDRQRWATVVCHACVPPALSKDAQRARVIDVALKPVREWIKDTKVRP